MGEEGKRKLSRRFRGVWIPAGVWLDERLSMVERALLAEVDSLSGGRGCYASNTYLARFMGVSGKTITRGIARLEELGLLTVQRESGRRRMWPAMLEHEGPGQNVLEGWTKCPEGMDKMSGRSESIEEKHREEGRPEEPPSFRDAVSWWFTQFQARSGGAKPSWGKAEGGLLKRLLERLGGEDLKAAMALYFAKEWWFTKQGYSFKGFYAHADELVTADRKREGAPARPNCPECGASLYIGGKLKHLPECVHWRDEE